jgi:P27 family predicted phage terminase small subunit
VIELHGNRSQLTKAELAQRRADEVKARPLAPRAPASLSKPAREIWLEHAPELERLGLLTMLDAMSFRLICEVAAVAVQALEDMRPRKADGSIDRRRKGLEVTVPDRKYGGVKRHPSLGAFFQASKEYRAWCVEFGLSPSARVSLRRPARVPAGEHGDDDLEELLGY